MWSVASKRPSHMPDDETEDAVTQATPLRPPPRRELSMFGHSVKLPGNKYLRMGLGVLFIIGGIFAFLPVLGLWMIPLGLAVLSVDIPWVRRHSARAMVAFHRRYPKTAEKIFPRRRPQNGS